MRINILFILLFVCFSVFAQKADYPDIFIKALVPSILKENRDCILTVSYLNKCSDSVWIYAPLISGDKNHMIGNIVIIVEKMNSNRYRLYPGSSAGHFFIPDSVEYIRPAKRIEPNGSVNLEYDLLKDFGYFDPGKYRLKISVLKAPFNFFPKRVMDYFDTDWIYFSVKKPIYEISQKVEK